MHTYSYKKKSIIIKHKECLKNIIYILLFPNFLHIPRINLYFKF